MWYLGVLQGVSGLLARSLVIDTLNPRFCNSTIGPARRTGGTNSQVSACFSLDRSYCQESLSGVEEIKLACIL